MHIRRLSIVVAALNILYHTCHAQFPPPANYTNIWKSPLNPNVTISFKSPSEGTCATIFSTQRQFTGYITLPPETLAPISQNYTINTFFWFVEARQAPESAPLTVWLNGGPGSSSLIGFFTENGPCEVVQQQDGSYGTQTRLWGWDRISNVLYIDQPVQVGLSYDIKTNSTLDLLEGFFHTPPTSNGETGPLYTFLNGTFSSQTAHATSNTSNIAARAVWHFLQTFLVQFPEYNPGVRPGTSTTDPTGVNLFTESYGGEYGPVFADYFESQNDLLQAKQLSNQTTLIVKLASVGILNGLVDWRIQAPYYPMFASNNTYNIKAIDTTAMNNALIEMNGTGGCLAQIDDCRTCMASQDSLGEGNNQTVNEICNRAWNTCSQYQDLLSSAGLSVYDIRQQDPSPFPSSAYIEYLNTVQVQNSIGTPINFTQSSIAADSFYRTGDPIRGTMIADLAGILNRGIRVAFLYGDADFICNWKGGEAISFNLAQQLAAYSGPFAAAGYAEIVVNSTYVGGEVRQFGNLSFARIYDAGHLIPAYQPETTFQVFARIIQGTAISTGEAVNLSSYSTNGPRYSTYRNSKGKSQAPVCWIRAIQNTCTSSERTSILAGQGAVLNGIWYANADDFTPPTSSVIAGSPGKPSPNATSAVMSRTTSLAPTGVYTATGTPSPKSTSSRSAYLSSPTLLILVIWSILLTFA